MPVIKLIPGTNDLATVIPEFAAEWHPTKNGDLLPTQIIAGGRKRVWWMCERGHEWHTILAQRINTRSGCKECKMIPLLRNSVAGVEIFSREWSPRNIVSPEHIAAQSNIKRWWLGECGHEWDSTPANRKLGKFGCPYCSGQRFGRGINDLATVEPSFAAEWHPTRNGSITARDVQRRTAKKYWWVCYLGHEWEASPHDRTKTYKDGTQKGKCPTCSNRILLTGFNDLATKEPQLAAEWHSTKNGDTLPIHIRHWSPKKFWWVSKQCGHEWYAPVNSRVQGNGCTKCLFSQVEQKLFALISNHYIDTHHSIDLPISWGKAAISKIDIYIRSENTIIEYDGSYWHRNKYEKDATKTLALLNAGYKVIRIRNQPLGQLDINHINYHEIKHYSKDPIENISNEVIEILRK